MFPTFAKSLTVVALMAYLPLAGQQEKPLDENATLSLGADHKLPNGKSQREEILKADYEKNLQDSAALVELAQSLQQDIEKDTRHVLSISSLKKTDEIEKLVKRIRARMRRF